MSKHFDASKPHRRLREFARQLGWRGLEMWQHEADELLVTWYSTSDRKFFLQINEHPIGDTGTYAAAVFADRYGIRTGFHEFALSDETATSTLGPWLNRTQFKNRGWRREFCSLHPECCMPAPNTNNCRARTSEI